MSRKRAGHRMIRFFGGPLDGEVIPMVDGYFREGDIECVDARYNADGREVPAAVYLMRDGDLHFMPTIPPTEMPSWMAFPEAR